MERQLFPSTMKHFQVRFVSGLGGLPLAVRTSASPPFVGKLSRVVAIVSVPSASVPVACNGVVWCSEPLFALAVSTAIFNATHQTQSRVDAELTNGQRRYDERDTFSNNCRRTSIKAGRLATVVAARAMQDGYAYVGNDLLDNLRNRSETYRRGNPITAVGIALHLQKLLCEPVIIDLRSWV